MANDELGGSGGRPPTTGPGNLERQPVVPELVHGGFRYNVQHQGIQELADERGMGRDILRQTSGGYPDELLDAGNDEIMAATPVRGSKEDYHVSPWAKDGK